MNWGWVADVFVMVAALVGAVLAVVQGDWVTVAWALAAALGYARLAFFQ